MSTNLPTEQQAIRAKCFHPSGVFTKFGREDTEQSVPQRFEDIVQRYGNRIAIRMADQNLTYAELNGMANRVARALVAGEASRAAPVGLLFEKGPPLIAAMLAVLKSGNFFVLLDPSFPNARLASIVKDVKAGCVIADRANTLLAAEVAGPGSRIVEFEGVACGASDADLGLECSPEALVYVTYTSGSTGRPKGVVQNHRNILHDAMLRINTWHIGEHDRISLLASGTSNAIKNAFFALLNGATLLPFDLRKEGMSGLATWLWREGISICRISSHSVTFA
ncbi:MAG: AMP-binding protein [Candidatus Binatia bacterium]